MAGAAGRLEAAGIAVRRVKPPFELGRVEHWNWAHYESQAEWLKPVFAGDWLELDYVAKLRAATLAKSGLPLCGMRSFCFASKKRRRQKQCEARGRAGFGRRRKWRTWFCATGCSLGRRARRLTKRTAFVAVGGYQTPLPICADSLMFCSMASRFGALGLPEALCHFNIPWRRGFRRHCRGRRRDTFLESLTYCLMLGYRAWAERVKFPKLAYARLLIREVRAFRKGK